MEAVTLLSGMVATEGPPILEVMPPPPMGLLTQEVVREVMVKVGMQVGVGLLRRRRITLRQGEAEAVGVPQAVQEQEVPMVVEQVEKQLLLTVIQSLGKVHPLMLTGRYHDLLYHIQ